MAKAKRKISGIAVRGFKSVCTEQHLDIRPLTILAGANSAGKSSFLQPLLLLKQTLEAPGDPGALLLDGPNVRFTRAEQLLSHTASKKGRNSSKKGSNEFGVKLELSDDSSLDLTYRYEPGQGFDVERMTYLGNITDEPIEMTHGMSHEAIAKLIPPHIKALGQRREKQEKETYHWTVSRDRCFLSFDLISHKKDPKKPQGWFLGPIISPSAEFIPPIQGVIHLPGLRGNPRRDYPKAAISGEYQGTFEPYVASVIAAWQFEQSDQLSRLGSALQDLGLTWKVKAEPVDDTRVELKVGRLPLAQRGGARDLVSIADVGFGVSQALPVVVALLAAQPGQLVYLEQPEIHLHPLAQRRLATVLKAALKRGVVVVVETHSILLLREVQTLVARGELEPKDIALHWVQRDAQGNTIAHSAELDEKGAYGDWPEDFDITELEAEQAYLDAVERNEARR